MGLDILGRTCLWMLLSNQIIAHKVEWAGDSGCSIELLLPSPDRTAFSLSICTDSNTFSLPYCTLMYGHAEGKCTELLEFCP